MKEPLSLADFSILTGAGQLDGGVLTLRPDTDGFIRLRLDGEQAGMGGARWSKAKLLIIDMKSDMDAMTTIDLLFYKKGKHEETPSQFGYHMIPTRRVKLVADLDELSSKRVFPVTLPGRLKGHVRCHPCDVAEMDRLDILIHPGYSRHFDKLEIYDAYLSDTLPDMTVIGDPMVDEMGQWIQKDWPGKTRRTEDMISYLKTEYARAKEGTQYPEGWSQWGGLLQKRFDATGYFHTHKADGRWWLVDPDGYAFISNGMCYGTRMGVHGFVDGMENLFQWLPEKDDPEFADAWTTADQIPEFVKRNTAEAGKNRSMFNFARANMIRAFGASGWWDAWVTINAARLKRWGFNTIGVGVNNYYDENVMRYLERAQIPFVWTLKEFPLTQQLIFRDFPDVFSKEYEEKSAHFARTQLAPFKGNPYMIGYFITNEPEWRFQHSTNIAERAFAHPERLATKEALVAFLMSRYPDISALNAAWGAAFDGFESLYTPFSGGDQLSDTAARDFHDMRALMLAKYNEVPSRACKEVDSHHLNLGMRFHTITHDEMTGNDWFDIISFNRYNVTALPELSLIEHELDMPAIIGEWHIGGGYEGLLSGGLLTAPNDVERAKACSYYLENAVANPCCVGLHYFEFNDQPLLGRFDGECMNHGVIDVCNHSFDTFMDAFSQSCRNLYALAEGKLPPTAVTGETFRPR